MTKVKLWMAYRYDWRTLLGMLPLHEIGSIVRAEERRLCGPNVNWQANRAAYFKRG